MIALILGLTLLSSNLINQVNHLLLLVFHQMHSLLMVNYGEILYTTGQYINLLILNGGLNVSLI